jgi:hypothetical protein
MLAAAVRPVAVACSIASGLALFAVDAAADDAVSRAASETMVPPPPSGQAFLQYGVALSTETVASPGPICTDAATCILGSGGGLAMRVGWRPSQELYVGGAYEVSKQDPHELYRLGILQQARVELRRYFPTAREGVPFVVVGAGVSGYGDEWAVDTWGPSGTIGGGIELQLGGPLVIVSLSYRPMYFQAWDSSTVFHSAGVAHLIGLEVAIEAQDTLQAAP